MSTNTPSATDGIDGTAAEGDNGTTDCSHRVNQGSQLGVGDRSRILLTADYPDPRFNCQRVVIKKLWKE